MEAKQGSYGSVNNRESDSAGSMRKDKDWFSTFDKFGGAGWVSGQSQRSVYETRRRRLNVPLILFASAVTIVIFYLLRARHSPYTDSEIPTAHKADMSNNTHRYGDNSDVQVDGTNTKQQNPDTSSCEEHIDCAKLGLKGECCPTKEGEMLSCCL